MSHVIYNRINTWGSVGFRIGFVLHYGWIYSHSLGNRSDYDLVACY